MTTRIENDDLAVTVDAAYGARVTSIVDKRTGREWMARGANSANTGENAVYAADEAVGWDECFPTVAPWDASATPWGRVLRDHGDLWGRPAAVVAVTPTRLTTRQADPLYSFERTLDLDGATLAARYRVENLSGQPLPYLWALHGLLNVGPDDRILLPGVATVLATYLGRSGKTVSAPSLAWPGPNAVWPEPLDAVLPASSQVAAKLYAVDIAGGSAWVGHGREWLRIGWDGAIDSLGIWLNYGGWPAPGRVHHIALEPTNAPVDHLGQAMERGTPMLAPRAVREWTVTFTFGAEPAAHDQGSGHATTS